MQERRRLKAGAAEEGIIEIKQAVSVGSPVKAVKS
jgi:hypothetical protein